MKREDPLTAIEDVRRRLGAPRVNISVLWVVVTQLASDLQFVIAELDSAKATVRYLQDLVIGLEMKADNDPVGGSDSAEPSSETEWYVAPQLPFDVP